MKIIAPKIEPVLVLNNSYHREDGCKRKMKQTLINSYATYAVLGATNTTISTHTTLVTKLNKKTTLCIKQFLVAS